MTGADGRASVATAAALDPAAVGAALGVETVDPGRAKAAGPASRATDAPNPAMILARPATPRRLMYSFFRCNRTKVLPGRGGPAAVRPRAGQPGPVPITRLRDLWDMTDQRDTEERSEPTDAHDPTDSSDNAEPIDPTDRNDPTEPIDSTEPFEPIDSRESVDQSDHLEDDRLG